MDDITYKIFPKALGYLLDPILTNLSQLLEEGRLILRIRGLEERKINPNLISIVI
ncbi:hypothetical protein P872_22095 [Rhodonellum psychrophilum GCM71 = DSM 17998]|uniref:Uncharacterized protein n=2 Tax=Rhodonellum TaxID=336827 RepID=U5BIN9_9BACT|nr:MULTISPECIES: hypothetical protein [Rhodonellum]ERM80275.1 hypothetical protein P872_22095 [Rhodonellum psychrophilum GCM71 = DSM 17998]MDO9551792.1 hypothetical protein [Rhodonellum sp.]SDZ17061.1 hypothetical protein SAMN05444412_10710 [Rhodonellum ikkaensis]